MKGDTTIAKDLQINEQIRESEVRLISESGEQLGTMPTSKARQIADEEGLDLVKIAQTTNESVCKLMDYGKYKFELAKKEKESKKSQKVVELKEIQLSIRIDKHDWDFKQKHAERFLTEGDKVKVVVKMKGREQANPEKALQIANNFKDGLADFCIIDKPAERQGRNVTVILIPKK